MKRLVECVPNFAEGRDLSKVDAIEAAIQEVPGVFLLARESDADHNRSVITLAGEPDAIVEAAVRAVGKAMELIDLTRQTGAHPRIGATDVVPFVPLEGVSFEDCVILAAAAAYGQWLRVRGGRPAAMRETVQRAVAAYRDPGRWAAVVRRGMAEDHSWAVPAAQYVAAYERAIAVHAARR